MREKDRKRPFVAEGDPKDRLDLPYVHRTEHLARQNRSNTTMSRYLCRAFAVAIAGWLTHWFAVDASITSHFAWPLMGMFVFLGLDRYMFSPQERLATRLATNTGQLIITVAAVACSAAVAVEPLPWQYLTSWTVLALLGISMLDAIPLWPSATPRVLLAYEGSPADAPDHPETLAKPREEAFTWLNSEQNGGRVEEVMIVDTRLTPAEQHALLQAIQRYNLRLNCVSPDTRTTPGSITAFQKRLFDVLSAALLILCCSPLLLLTALIVRLQDGGPAMFRQQRLGMGGACITILKFRSMQVAACSDPMAPQAKNHDPRVTPFGRWIRYWGIDELPQLFNVLNGDMSIVGPRPHAVAHDLHYGACITHYYRRLDTRPGITGLAQIRGFRGETQVIADMQQRVEADLEYVARQSMLLDLYILAVTPFVLLKSGTANASTKKHDPLAEASRLEPEDAASSSKTESA